MQAVFEFLEARANRFEQSVLNELKVLLKPDIRDLERDHYVEVMETMGYRRSGFLKHTTFALYKGNIYTPDEINFYSEHDVNNIYLGHDRDTIIDINRDTKLVWFLPIEKIGVLRRMILIERLGLNQK
jgi:hypothetical protein